MKKELQDKLYEKHPKIFKKKNDKNSCMIFGIDTGNGWYDLIDTLCTTIQHNVDWNDIPQVEVTQLKEKFGTMRYYTVGGDERTRGMIRFAEMMSGKICEECGSAGYTRHDLSWILTLCDSCYYKKNKENSEIEDIS